MAALSDVDAAVIDLVREEFETMGEFRAEGPNSKVTVDPADAFGPDSDGDPSDSIFYSSVRGEFMDWGFRFICIIRDAFPEGADHVMTEFTPYAELVVKRLLQTWSMVGAEQWPSPPDEGWITGNIMDSADAKQARERHAKLYGEDPPDSYFSRLSEADEDVIRVGMTTAPARAFDSAEDFRQQCPDGETALFHIDYTDPELTQLY